jgi:hypothetical protein
LDFRLWIWDLHQLCNPHFLARTFCNTITVSPDPVYKMINIVLWSPGRQGGPYSANRNELLLTPVI